MEGTIDCITARVKRIDKKTNKKIARYPMRESKSWRRYFANGLVGDTMVKTVLLVKQGVVVKQGVGVKQGVVVKQGMEVKQGVVVKQGVEVKQGVVFDGKPHLLGKQAMAQSRQATSAGKTGNAAITASHFCRGCGVFWGCGLRRRLL